MATTNFKIAVPPDLPVEVLDRVVEKMNAEFRSQTDMSLSFVKEKELDLCVVEIGSEFLTGDDESYQLVAQVSFLIGQIVFNEATLHSVCKETGRDYKESSIAMSKGQLQL